jgi:hypothetical protein
MKTVKDLGREIEDVSNEVQKLVAQRGDLVAKWAIQAATRKNGDTFTQSGYPHHGKQCQIVSVRGRLAGGFPIVEYRANVLKKDGTLSTVEFDLTFMGGV